MAVVATAIVARASGGVSVSVSVLAMGCLVLFGSRQLSLQLGSCATAGA